VSDEPRTALVPTRQEIVHFYGDDILAAEIADGTVYVPMRPLCEHLGLTWPSQSRRLNDDPTFVPYLGTIVVTTEGGPQAMLALPLKIIPGWLGKLQPLRVRPELQPKIIRYQQECYEVLWNAFKAEIRPGPPAGNLSGAELAVENARAILHLAEQQLELERRYNTMADYMRGFVKETKARLSALELQVAGEGTIDEAQAAEIGLAVKHVAVALAGQDGGNHYGAVYNELYRRFGVASYKNIARSQYPHVLAWLRSWFDEVSGAGGGPARDPS
jgi:hypothetical protein